MLLLLQIDIIRKKSLEVNMKEDVFGKFNYRDDIEIMNLEYQMKSRQKMPNINEDYIQSLQPEEKTIQPNRKWN